MRRKAIPGYGGRYEVTDDGHVLSNGLELENVRGRYVTLSWQGVTQQVSVCYLVARAFVGNIEGRPYVVHKNGDRTDNRAENLEWSEVKERRPMKVPEGGIGVVVTERDGTYVGAFATLRGACDTLRIDYSAARRCCEGKQKRVGKYVVKWC